jgi:dienelactone hydrolase
MTPEPRPAQADDSLVETLRERTSRVQALSPQAWPSAPPPGFEGLACTRFEISSRGDRVPGHVLEADRDDAARRPLVLLQHGAGGDRFSAYLQVARRWVESGAAVATIDFPLHGERRSPKLSDRLLASISSGIAHGSNPGSDQRSDQRSDQASDQGPAREAEPAAGADPAALWRGFAQQAVADLRATLDYLLEVPRIDGDRCTYAAFSLGSILGSLFLAVDERPRAAALALGGGGFGPVDLDPASFIGALAPRPLLMVNARQDTVVPAAAAEALFAAAGEPREIEWFETGHDHLPGVALKRMWLHLDRAAQA